LLRSGRTCEELEFISLRNEVVVAKSDQSVTQRDTSCERERERKRKEKEKEKNHTRNEQHT
jgi:hypothetical protein